jgi:gliding motility-associated-like protein
MRIYFDDTEDSACMLDYVEFEYDTPLISGGMLAEIYPAEVPLGEQVEFSYFLRPQFATGERTEFNRIEIDVPSADTRIDTLMFDGQPWIEVPASGTSADPLVTTTTRRLPPAAGAADSLGQFAQTVLTDSATGESKLLIKLAPFGARHFRFDEEFEIALRSRLFRGAKQFSSIVWNDQTSTRTSMIPQPTQAGDVTPEVATDGIVVVARQIGKMVKSAQVTPNPFTPNGDGVNDAIHFTFDLYLVLERVQADLRIYDLSGHEVHRIDAAGTTAGRVDLTWDGRDGKGSLLPPGTYLYRLKVDSDDATSQQTGTLAIAY